MITSVSRQVFDKDVVCSYGFELVSSNQFKFPVSTLISPSTLDGAAVIGAITPITSLTSQNLTATNSIALLSDATPTTIINSDGLTSNVLNTYYLNCVGPAWIQGVGFLTDFYNSFLTIQGTMVTYASNLNLITSTMISNAIVNIGSYTVSSTQWNYLHTLNQPLMSSASPTFSAATIGALGANSITSATTISAFGAISGISISSTSGSITSNGGDIIASGSNSVIAGSGGFHTATGPIVADSNSIVTGESVIVGKQIKKGPSSVAGVATIIQDSSFVYWIRLSDSNSNYYEVDMSGPYATDAAHGIASTPGQFHAGDMLTISSNDLTKNLTLSGTNTPASGYNIFLDGTPNHVISNTSGSQFAILNFDGSHWRVNV